MVALIDDAVAGAVVPEEGIAVTRVVTIVKTIVVKRQLSVRPIAP